MSEKLLFDTFPFLKEITIRCCSSAYPPSLSPLAGDVEQIIALARPNVQMQPVFSVLVEFKMDAWVRDFVAETPETQCKMLMARKDGECIFALLMKSYFCCLTDSPQTSQISATFRISFLTELTSLFSHLSPTTLLPIVLHTKLVSFLVGLTMTHHDQLRVSALITLDSIANSMSPPASGQKKSGASKTAKETWLRRQSDNCYSQLYDMDRYVESFGHLTFRSYVCPLQSGEQSALAAAIKAISPVYFAALAKEQAGIQRQDWLHLPQVRSALSEKHLQGLENIRLRLDALMKKQGAGSEGGGEEGFFVKLSTRSPKDSLMMRGRAQLLEAQGHSEEEAKRLCLCVKSGADALELLCGSQRVLEDLERGRGGAADGEGVKETDEVKSTPLCLVVRRWARMEAWGELRGFVNHRRLTALSQYATAPIYLQLVTHHALIVEAVQSFFNVRLAHLLPLEHAVVDFGLIVSETADSLSTCKGNAPNGCDCGLVNGLRVVVIELNPFGKTSGASLFRWYDDADYDVMSGARPFEFRFNS